MAARKAPVKKKALHRAQAKTTKKVPVKAKPKTNTKPPPKLKPKKKRAPKVAPEDKPLTGKQQLFVMWYTSDIVNCNATEAARRAGYTGSDVTIRTTAHENLTKPNVKKAIDTALKASAKDAGVTVESTMRKLGEIREKSIEAGQFGPAARCTELQGKYLKMFTDRIEHVATMDDMTTEDLLRLARQLAEESGIDIGKLLAGSGSGDGDMLDYPGSKKTH